MTGFLVSWVYLILLSQVSAAPPKWVEQAAIVAEVVLNGEDNATLTKLSPEEQKAQDDYIAARWKAAEEGSAAKYLKLIGDRKLAVEWMKEPWLEEPANPILVDPLNAAALDRDPVYYVNGPWRTRAEAVREARRLARLMNQAVWLVYNPTIEEAEEVNREDYLRLLAFLVFFGITVPENLVEATLDGAQLVDIEGLQEQSLADVAEAQWDTRWFDWMRQPPVVEIAGRKQTVYPHQHNETTRQLASILLHANRPLTVVTHSQGGLIFRNAALIASKLGNGDWSKRKVTWRSLAFPLSEKPKKAFLPGLVQVQFLFSPEDPLALLLSGRGPFAIWANPSGQPDAWGFVGFDGLDLINPILIGPTSWPTIFVNFNPPELTYQYGRRLRITNNDTTQRMRIHVQYRRQNGNQYVWEPPAATPAADWPFIQLDPGETAFWGDPAVVTPAIRYWAEYERGWRDTSQQTNTFWLVNQNNPMYLSNVPQTRDLSPPTPSGTQDFDNELVEVVNNSGQTVVVQLRARWTNIDKNLETPGELSKKEVIQNNGSVLLVSNDADAWPIRAVEVEAIEMEAQTGAPTYEFPAGGITPTATNPFTSKTAMIPGTFPYQNLLEMNVQHVVIPP